MQIVKQTSYVIVNDDGTPIPEELNQCYQELMKKFTEANVLGKHSPISPYSALRMAMVSIQHHGAWMNGTLSTEKGG
ncbi:hypothetical protein CMI47_07435 [Candidatus Pacearchaeota archaeon]|nr:hypothetical protein [Candidatus Pacearchaeota archaeon]|tara:strand:+ start:1180 stop:1410 length:231 start_codon:yes stop_codon:yes gene_type:complete